MARNTDLEAVIASAPADFASYLVYSDWLTEQGDPRGELIALHRLKKHAEAEALLTKHAAHFYGSFAGLFFDEDEVLTAEWDMGFLRSCRLASSYGHDPEFADDKSKAIDIHALLEELLDHPSACFLRALTLGIVKISKNDYTRAFEILGARRLPLLRELFVGDFHREQTELNWSALGVTRPLYGAAPNLEKLTLRSGSMDLEGIDLPELRELHIITGGFDGRSLAALCAARWPKLETLELQLGNEHRFSPDDLAPILEGASFPALKHLGLTNSTIADEIAAAVVKSKIVRRLETLDLSLGTLGTQGAAALVEGRAALAHLSRVDVSQSWIGPTALAALASIGTAVVTNGQQMDDDPTNDEEDVPENRYIAAYE